MPVELGVSGNCVDGSFVQLNRVGKPLGREQRVAEFDPGGDVVRVKIEGPAIGLDCLVPAPEFRARVAELDMRRCDCRPRWKSIAAGAGRPAPIGPVGSARVPGGSGCAHGSARAREIAGSVRLPPRDPVARGRSCPGAGWPRRVGVSVGSGDTPPWLAAGDRFGSDARPCRRGRQSRRRLRCRFGNSRDPVIDHRSVADEGP